MMGAVGGMEGSKAHVEHGEDDAYGALVRVDCGQKGAATVRANKCLVVKMSHMAFCMWRPLSVGRTDSDMCVPRPNDARNERWKAGEKERAGARGKRGPFYVKHAPKSYEFYYK